MEISRKIASPVIRLIAYLTDRSIGLLLFSIMVYYLSTSIDVGVIAPGALIFFVAMLFILPVIYAFINSLLISRLGGTFGKILTGTEIAGINGNRLSFWKAFFRNLIGYKISGVFFWLGFIWILVDKERRSWHDQITGSYVYVKNKTLGFFSVLFLLVFMAIALLIFRASFINFSKTDFSYPELIESVSPALPSDGNYTY